MMPADTNPNPETTPSLQRQRGAALSRTDVRQVDCPACGARAGQWCWTYYGGKSKRRWSNHRERIHAAYRALEDQ